MNLVALLIATALMGIGAPIVVQYLATPIRGTSQLSAQTAATAFAESVQWKIRRRSGALDLQGGVLRLSYRDPADELITEVISPPPGCSFLGSFNGADGVFVSCNLQDQTMALPSVVPLVSARHCESDLFPGDCLL